MRAVTGALTATLACVAVLTVASPATPAGRVLPRFAAPKIALRMSSVAPVTDIAAADVNGDGLTDLVVARHEQQTTQTFPLTILLNKGNGRFVDGSRAIFAGTPPMTQDPRQIVIADFNGDRRPDIFIADTGMDALPYPGHQNTLILSQPNGKLVDATANLPQQSDFTHSAAAADVDGNGTIDLYVGNLSSGCCAQVPPEILLNDGTGHFRVAAGALPSDVGAPLSPHYNGSAFVDVNGDKAPDLVLAAGHETAGNLVLVNDRTGHFQELPGALPAKPFGPTTEGLGVGAADVNGDGHQDLFVVATKWDPFYRGVWLQVLVGKGDGTFTDETATRLPQSDNTKPWIAFPEPLDLNGDGKPDLTTRAATLAVGGESASPTPTFLNDGHGNFKAIRLAATSGGIYAFVNDTRNKPARDVVAVVPATGHESYVFYRRLS